MKRIWFMLLLILFLAGCERPPEVPPTLVSTIDLGAGQKKTQTAAPSATPQVVATKQAASSPTPRPSQTAPHPAQTPTPDVWIAPTRGVFDPPMPAALYLLKEEIIPDGKPRQIWKVTADGKAAYPVTVEAGEVKYPFNVSKYGRLAYVSQNRLIITDSEGKDRREVKEGKAPPEKPDEWWYLREEVSYPAWSPDGKRIAYFQGGVNVLDVDSGDVALLLKDANAFIEKDGRPQLVDPNSVQEYKPIDWTPDGSRIVLKGEGQNPGMFILPALPGGKMVQVEAAFSGNNLAGCCDYSFTPDGQMLFSSGVDRYIGLWKIDPRTGIGKALTVPLADVEYPGVGIWLPRQAPDGRIFFFASKNEISRPPFPLAYMDGKKIPFRAPEDVTFVKADQQWFEPMAGLWYPDASHVIVRGETEALWILDAATGLGVSLEIKGECLRWGAE